MRPKSAQLHVPTGVMKRGSALQHRCAGGWGTPEAAGACGPVDGAVESLVPDGLPEAGPGSARSAASAAGAAPESASSVRRLRRRMTYPPVVVALRNILLRARRRRVLRRDDWCRSENGRPRMLPRPAASSAFGVLRQPMIASMSAGAARSFSRRPASASGVTRSSASTSIEIEAASVADVENENAPPKSFPA